MRCGSSDLRWKNSTADRGFLLLYLLTGVAGVAASYWYHPDVVSAGASGAIFRAVWRSAGFRLSSTGRRSRRFSASALGTGVLPDRSGSISSSVSRFPQIDNSAHIGGLIAGALLAAADSIRTSRERRTPGFQGSPGRPARGCGARQLLRGGRHYAGPERFCRQPVAGWGQYAMGSRSTVRNFIDAINSAQDAFEHSADCSRPRATPRGDIRRSSKPRPQTIDR